MVQQLDTRKQQQQLDEAEWLLRRKKISVPKAAELAGVSEDSFRRHYSHLIKQVTPGRQVVETGDAIDLPSATAE